MRRLMIIITALAILIPMIQMAGYGTSLAQSIPGVGIGTNSPDPSAILDIDFTDKGVLFPRLTTAQRDGIGVPAPGLLIYNMDDNVLQVYDGSAWQ